MDEIQKALQAELDRLLTLDLTGEEELIARRYYSQKERDSMDAGSFCGPHQSFPVQSQEDVTNAAGLAGHAEDPAAVRACIRSKAKAHGWKLPASWENDKDDGDHTTRVSADHAPMKGSHAHPHPAYGDQGGDDSHAHGHSHDDDNDHHHAHDDQEDETPGDEGKNEDETEKGMSADILRTMPSETTIYAPVIRFDKTKREVVVRATAEDLDTYQTVIGYEASKEAFGRWRGNIREMHDSTKAVGRAIKWDPVEEEKAIDLTLRVSRGAEDTWQKLIDGTLSGASIGARNGKWGKRQWKGKEVPFLERYDLVEVSLVDNPSCPGCDVKIVRSAGADQADTFLATDILDFTEEQITPPVTPAPQPESVERKGARFANKTQTSIHKSRDHALQGVREMLSTCACDECKGALGVLDPDGDGDIDIVPSLDTDSSHTGQSAKAAVDAAGGDGSGVMKAALAEITRQIAPTIQRMNAIAARLSSVPEQQSGDEKFAKDLEFLAHSIQSSNPDITRRMDLLEQRLSKIDELDEVRSVLAEVKGLAERSIVLSEQIAAQPASGGPIVNSAIMRQASADGYAPQSDPTALEAEVLARLARSGILNKDQQVNAVMYLQRLQQQGTSARR